MNNKKYIVIGLILMLLAVGWFLPIGSYTTKKGCWVDPIEHKRLHLILGDSIDEIKKRDVEPQPNMGCSFNATYVLYLL